MTFHEEMIKKQEDKNKKCRQRVYNYMDKGIENKACKKCNQWKHVGFAKVCNKFSREVYLASKDKLAMSCY